MKLKGAVFSPLTENQCVIKVCGFTSFTSSRPPLSTKNTNLIGSFSDYADCEIITKNETKASSYVYNDAFNASSIGCGCSNGAGECVLNCFERDVTWKENECAILYQESFCKSCHFKPISIQQDIDLFITDNTHHIHSARVRKNCTLIQDITGLNRIWRFENKSREIHYNSTPTASNVKSAFLINPEIFSCTCNALPPAPIQPLSFDLHILVYTLAGFSTILGVALLSALIYICKLRFIKAGLNPDILHENVSTCGGSIEFDYSQLENSPLDPRFLIENSQLQFISQLGEGNFGEVVEETLRVATKSVNPTSRQRQLALESLRQEIKILTHLGVHQNVVRFLGYCNEGELKLVMELCQNKSLHTYLVDEIWPELEKTWKLLLKRKEPAQNQDDTINSDEKDPLELDAKTKRQFLQWSEEIAEGMRYITFKKIIHVDLATRNVLLDKRLTAKIGDFGLSMKTYLKDYQESTVNILPLMWLAPEVLTHKRCSSKSDVWSYGITIWEIFSIGRKPFINVDLTLHISALESGRRLERPYLLSEDVYKKLLSCWHLDPNFRPSFNHLRNFFREQKNQLTVVYADMQSAGST
ncbi:Myoblast growth factor receptor egl-15 [Orchesella cincta]|uniref:Myoblast growth factor receptor egl-15 n=1 Tax=Orchesella cincta TaxID=48709 RepID=A0A1D2MGB0_ORCCI|nr:Myoblast growth factor receptor egl-15 [Orchesella cincta]